MKKEKVKACENIFEEYVNEKYDILNTIGYRVEKTQAQKDLDKYSEDLGYEC